ncbi:hypothetical protein ISG33_08620 [Glaciecola sp. MH2013]|uniref:hypothetical protein n=1 Tax=Glaciecola sp. MH2013 TaxID=2785524 RepID=UPI00189DE908|nr:hypothetical protein [Glaciecola sp. MH2013]MBF7073456.1 hypothetical protein [Glaciecola sp. MH2013]
MQNKRWQLVSLLPFLTLLHLGAVSANTGIGSPPLDCNQLGWLSYNPQDFIRYITQGDEGHLKPPVSLYRHEVLGPQIEPYSLPTENYIYETALKGCYLGMDNVVYSNFEMVGKDKIQRHLARSAELIVKYVSQMRADDLHRYNKEFEYLSEQFNTLTGSYARYQTHSEQYAYTELYEKIQSQYFLSKTFTSRLENYQKNKMHPNQAIRDKYVGHIKLIDERRAKIEDLILFFEQQAKMEKELITYIAKNDLSSIKNPSHQEKVKLEIQTLLKEIKSQKVRQSIGRQANELVNTGENQFLILIFMSIVTIFTSVGTIIGLARKAPVYYDFDDLMYSVGIFAWPVAISLFVFSIPIPTFLAHLVLWGPTFFLAYKSITNTWRLGQRMLLPIIVVTKIVWSIMLVLAILMAMNPSGKTARSRRTQRSLALFFLVVVTPIVSKLIANKNGKIFNPNVLSISGTRGVDRIGRALRG